LEKAHTIWKLTLSQDAARDEKAFVLEMSRQLRDMGIKRIRRE
jgi:hypothetical protein